MDSSLPIKTIRTSRFYLTILSMAEHIPGDDEYRDSLLLLPLVGLCTGAVSVLLGYLAYVTVGWPLHTVFAVAASTGLTAGLYYKDCAALLKFADVEAASIQTTVFLVFSIMMKTALLLALGLDWWLAALFAPMMGRLAYLYSRLSATNSEQLPFASLRSVLGIGAPLLFTLAVIKLKLLAVLAIVGVGIVLSRKFTPLKEFRKEHAAQASGVICEGAEVLSMFLLCAFY